jgi:hypothetical protein
MTTEQCCGPGNYRYLNRIWVRLKCFRSDIKSLLFIRVSQILKILEFLSVESFFPHHFKYKPTAEKTRSVGKVEVKEGHFTFSSLHSVNKKNLNFEVWKVSFFIILGTNRPQKKLGLKVKWKLKEVISLFQTYRYLKK